MKKNDVVVGSSSKLYVKAMNQDFLDLTTFTSCCYTTQQIFLGKFELFVIDVASIKELPIM